MEPRTTEPDALWHVYKAMDRLLSLLPTGPRAVGPLGPLAALPLPLPLAAAPPAPRPEDLAIQEAIDKVLEYHCIHQPKNTAWNYRPKQKE
jgi:hypothetical protein